MLFLTATSLLLAGWAVAQNSTAVSLTVSKGSGNATSPLQYGIMFEDINHSGDGGIYAELIQNRAFQGASSVDPFVAVGAATLSLSNTSIPLSSALPQSLKVSTSGAKGQVGFSNPGYWGIDVKPQKYTGSFYVYGSYRGSFVASLVNDISGKTLATAKISSHASSSKWVEHTYTLFPEAAAPNVNNSLAITFDGSAVNGSLNFNLISLFPPTYKNRPNGMRVDLMEALKGLTPSFLRMPGGNNLEGDDPNPAVAPPRWKWNETIGPLTDRPGRLGDWGYENTDGLGLVEYLNWCIDLDMEPVLALWAGFYLSGPVVPASEIEIYVQDALKELDFIMGSPSTEGGALRVALGYGEAPLYNIKYVEIGNEDNLGGGGGSYASYRFSAFYNAISAAWPNITIIASTIAYTLPGNAGGDYHEYTRPDYFVSLFNYFDQFPSTHPILIGEYATVQPNEKGQLGTNWNEARFPFPFWIGTVAEAVFLIGAERNAAAILGASYAPLLQNLDSYEWAPDMISFTADPAQDVLSTSYHLVKLFSNTRIAETLPVATNASFGPAYWVAGTSESSSSSYLLKAAVYNTTTPVSFSVDFPSVRPGAKATLTVLTAPDPYSMNTIGEDLVKTTVTEVRARGNGTLAFSLPEWSVALLSV